MKLRANEAAADQIPPGMWPGRVEHIESGPLGEFGETMRWHFSASVDGRLMSTDALSGIVLSPNAKATKWITALLGRPLGASEEVDTEALHGLPCRLVVESKPDSMFTNVTSVLAAPSAPGGYGTTPPAYQVPADERPF